jgi:predicted nuclease of restriction endonuclease-like (RecB) superfamily
MLIEFYWVLGKKIAEKETKWGSKFLETLSNDLQSEFPEMKGFSVSNLKTCKLFYMYFPNGSQPVNQIDIESSSQAVNSNSTDIIFQIPWGHTKHLITKLKDKEEALFYIKKIIQNNWSRDVLALQIKSNLYQREGKSINNFRNSLPTPFSDLALQTLKDPYVFDFLQLSEDFKEKDIENQLVNHIRKFLLELGKGFAFVGQQHHIQIAEKDYYIDLLFYHIKLKCYVVIELKNTSFIPEYAGKLNFYLSAVDTILKDENDKPTIGILLCREKNNVEAEFALRDINKPIGVSEFQLTEIIPEELKSSLPTIEEIEKEFKIHPFK